MTTLTQSNDSLSNTTLLGPDGRVVYEICTPHKPFGGTTTTISRNGMVLASIEWHSLQSDKLTFEGRRGSVAELFPTSSIFSMSRTYMTRSGELFKWKEGSNLYCVSQPAKTSLAEFKRTADTVFWNKKPVLEVTQSGMRIVDALVVTWLVMAKKIRDKTTDRSKEVGGGFGG